MPRLTLLCKDISSLRNCISNSQASLINFSPIGWNDKKIPFLLDDLSRLLTNFFMNQTLLKLPKKLVQHQTIKLSDHLIELFGGLNMWWGIQQCMLESLQFIIYMYWHQYFLLDVLTVYAMILYITYQILKFFFFLCFCSDSSRVITLDSSKAKIN